jgi:ribosomal protein S12 methylthiotransferase accessory factor
MDYPVRDSSEFLFPITSNGLAAGGSLVSAILSAIYEVIERDAFMLAWLQRWPGASYDPLSHPDTDVRHLAEAYRRRGVRLALVGFTVDHPVSVFAAIAFQEAGLGGPAATVGLGSDLNPAVAARKAAMEVAQVRPSLRRRFKHEQSSRVEELANDPTLVSTLEDHALLYASPQHIEALSFLEGAPAPWSEDRDDTAVSTAADPRGALHLLIKHFQMQRQDVIYIDLSAPELKPLGLHCVRAILPDYQPIWFGYREPRLGGKRLRELPARLGRATGPFSLDELNSMPHHIA